MKATIVFSSMVLMSTLLCTACGSYEAPPARAEQEQATPSTPGTQVLTAQEPVQVLSANMSHQDVQVIRTDHAQTAQFASQAEAPCDTCGNGIWRVFNLSSQSKLLTAFVALLALSAAFLYRRARHRTLATTH